MKEPRLIASRLRDVARLLRLRDGKSFRARAYDVGARSIEQLGDAELDRLVSEDRLTELPGIGEGLASQVRALVRDGTAPVLAQLEADLPAGAAELARVPGMTAKRMRLLAEELAVASLDDLERACAEHRVRGLKGFGEATEQRLLRGIHEAREPSAPALRRTLLVDALGPAGALVAHARALPHVARAEVAGSLRRWKESVGGLVLVVGARDPGRIGAIADALLAYPAAARAERRGADVRLWLGVDLQADVHVVADSAFTIELLRRTGSSAHVARLEQLARQRRVALDAPPSGSEAEIYGRIGLSFVPPELREDAGEIALAEHDDFASLVATEDIRGMVHCHTVHSDGKNTILEMAREAEAMGMDYITITDHSPAASYAGGLDLDRLERQWEEIDRAQAEVKIKILRGTESDILSDGQLDYPEDVLARMDVVIASVHARFRMDEAQMTERIVRAMRAPVFKIWGHALGRLLLHRPPIACRVPEILDAIAGARAAIEVNGDPYRLDLAPEWIREARARGIPFVVSVDAHSTRGLHNLVFGVETARRGGLCRADVLNTLSAGAFADAVKP